MDSTPGDHRLPPAGSDGIGQDRMGLTAAAPASSSTPPPPPEMVLRHVPTTSSRSEPDPGQPRSGWRRAGGRARPATRRPARRAGTSRLKLMPRWPSSASAAPPPSCSSPGSETDRSQPCSRSRIALHYPPWRCRRRVADRRWRRRGPWRRNRPSIRGMRGLGPAAAAERMSKHVDGCVEGHADIVALDPGGVARRPAVRSSARSMAAGLGPRLSNTRGSSAACGDVLDRKPPSPVADGDRADACRVR